MINFGKVAAGATLYVPFHTFNAAGASVTLTGLAVTDIEIYKNGSTTQRSSDAGYTLLDTDGIDFDGITGIHGFSIDLADNTDSGFYSAGGFFWIVVSAVTIDSQTVNFVAGVFSIEPAVGINVNVVAIAGTAVTAAAGIPEVKVASIAANAITATSIAADAITAAKVADGTIDAATFASGAITAASFDADAITAAKIAADVTTEIQSGLATAAALTTVAGYIDTEVASILAAVDTEVAAIKAKTDSLTFTVAGQVDANIQYVNDTQIQGDGSVGSDEWRKV